MPVGSAKKLLQSKAVLEYRRTSFGGVANRLIFGNSNHRAVITPAAFLLFLETDSLRSGGKWTPARCVPWSYAGKCIRKRPRESSRIKWY